MNFSRRTFAQVLGLAPLVFAARSAIAAPLLRPIFPQALSSLESLRQALVDAGFANAVVGYDGDRQYIWSRVSQICSDGIERHSLVRDNGSLAALTNARVEASVRAHRALWRRGAHRRQVNGLIPAVSA